LILFCLVGCQVNLVANLSEYLQSTHVLPMQSTHRVSMLFWASTGVGTVCGMLDQRRLASTSLNNRGGNATDVNRNDVDNNDDEDSSNASRKESSSVIVTTDELVTTHLSNCCIVGSVALLAVVCYPSSAFILYSSITLFGLSFGPTIGYCMDLNNRLTLPTEFSTSILILALNMGASAVPYVTTIIWQRLGPQPTYLMMVCLFCMTLPVPLLSQIRFWSYNKTFPDFELTRPATLYEYFMVKRLVDTTLFAIKSFRSLSSSDLSASVTAALAAPSNKEKSLLSSKQEKVADLVSNVSDSTSSTLLYSSQSQYGSVCTRNTQTENIQRFDS
jgi:hypothetical protein